MRAQGLEPWTHGLKVGKPRLLRAKVKVDIELLERRGVCALAMLGLLIHHGYMLVLRHAGALIVCALFFAFMFVLRPDLWPAVLAVAVLGLRAIALSSWQLWHGH